MSYTKRQLYFLVTLRIFIGWHFLYEGFLKLLNPGWSSQGYLLSAEGPFSWLFSALSSEGLIGVTDVLTITILLASGLTLLLGFKEKLGAYLGMIMLLLFYLAHPSWPGLNSGPSEGNYFIINKNLIELVALGVISVFPTGKIFGLDQFISKK